jgi:hypothetical protein
MVVSGSMHDSSFFQMRLTTWASRSLGLNESLVGGLHNCMIKWMISMVIGRIVSLGHCVKRKIKENGGSNTCQQTNTCQHITNRKTTTNSKIDLR